MRLRKEEGYPLRMIAEELGLSRGRVWQLCRSAKEKLEEYEADPKNGMALLDVRVRNCLGNLGYTSRFQVLADIESGKLWWDEKDSGHWNGRETIYSRPGINLAGTRNFGRKCWMMLQVWLGLRTAEDLEAEDRQRKEEAARRRAVREEEERRRAEEWRVRMKAKLKNLMAGDQERET